MSQLVKKSANQVEMSRIFVARRSYPVLSGPIHEMQLDALHRIPLQHNAGKSPDFLELLV